MANSKTGLVAAVQAIQARKQATSTPRAQKGEIVPPTPERAAHGPSRRAGLATRFDNPIDRLHEQGHLTQEQFDTFKVYAEQAALAEKSTMRDSCDFSVRGSGGGEPSAAIVSARIQTALMENRAGPHADLVRKVVRDGQSLTQYCIEKHGGYEKYDKRGRFVAMVPRGKGRVLEEARKYLRIAALWMAG